MARCWALFEKEVIPLATKFDASPRPLEGPSKLSRWRSLLAPAPIESREDIERDAAARLGVPLEVLTTAPAPDVPEVPAAAAAPARRGRLGGWLRNLVEAESPEARRQRFEAEAAAEVGLDDRQEQPAV